MRVVPILLAALMFGIAGGYAWSSIQPQPARVQDKIAPVIETGRSDRVATQESVYYAGCNEVRAAGKAPLHAGDPGYRAEMDGDGDGLACEPKPAT